MKPVLIPPAPLQHFYRGGARLAALRGIVAETDHQPEEWLAATVSRFGDPSAGPSVLADGTRFAELVASDPESWVGPQPSSAPSDTGLLFKLLDAGQRLPVHIHPGRAFARTHLDCPYGKTEAWYVLDAAPGALLHVGWRVDVDRAEAERRRDAQDGEWMLDHMNPIPAVPGRGVLVPAGQVHAIGADIFVAEVQEPTDLSILLEWSVTTSGREDSHLGLGFDTAMDAISYRALGDDDLAHLVVDAPPASALAESVLPVAADPYFRLAQVRGGAEGSDPIDAGYAVVLACAGDGELVGADGSVPVRQGEVLAVPHSFGPWRAVGDAELLVGRPGAGWPSTLADAIP